MRLAGQLGDPVLSLESVLGRAWSLPAYFADPDARVKGRALLEQVLESAQELGDPMFCITAHGNLSEIALLDGETQTARSHVESELALAKELGIGDAGRTRLAAVLLAEADPGGALGPILEALGVARRADSPRYVANCAEAALLSAAALGAYEFAARLYGFSQREFERAGVSSDLSSAFCKSRHHEVTFGRRRLCPRAPRR